MPSTNNYSQFSENKQNRRSDVNENLARPRSSSLDTPVSKKQDRFSSSIMETIKKESRGNPVMADILADTAMTTLPKMLSNGDNGSKASSRVTQLEHFAGSPEEVFGDEVASKWANLAFMDAPGKKLS